MASSSPQPEIAAEPQLDVKLRFTRALVLVRASGQLTSVDGHLLEDAVEAALAQILPDQLLMLDLSRISHYECEALAALGPVLTRVHESGIEIHIKDGPVRVPDPSRPRLVR